MSKTKKSTPVECNNAIAANLVAWLSDPRSDEYFGPVFRLRWEILANEIERTETLAAIAARHGVTRPAASNHAIAARRIFGLPRGKKN